MLARDLPAGIAAACGITAPVWLRMLEPAAQAIMAGLGIVALVLTIRGKLIDNRIKRAALAREEAECPPRR